MSDARTTMLAKVRAALGRGPHDGVKKSALETRVVRHNRNLVPKRAQLDHDGQVALFVEMAERAAATITRVATLAAVPEAVNDFLKRHNLPQRLKTAPDPAIARLPWAATPLLQIETGIAHPDDTTSLAPAFAAVAETGTLMMLSGPNSPTTLNFLPENHIVLLRADQVVGPYEDAWDRLRAARGGPDQADWPRTVNFITGPSRSADIEQQLQMGAHGPRRLHIILVAEESDGQGKG